MAWTTHIQASAAINHPLNGGCVQSVAFIAVHDIKHNTAHQGPSSACSNCRRSFVILCDTIVGFMAAVLLVSCSVQAVPVQIQSPVFVIDRWH